MKVATRHQSPSTVDDVEDDAVSRFCRYVRIHTTSAARQDQVPSTQCQFDLARLLVDECTALGLEEIHLDENCYLMATLPSNIPSSEPQPPTIGFIVHLDTTPDEVGENVVPVIHRNYDGESDLVLGHGTVLSPREFPVLSERYAGNDIITSSGDTLLGADDKAGIAAVMSAMKWFVDHPEAKHGRVRVCFTPDEEVGHLCSLLDLDQFGAKYAYTLDGCGLGEFSYENFNAYSALVRVKGRNCHPLCGNKLCNAAELAMEFHQSLPLADRPVHTEGREGFIFLTGVNGDMSETNLRYIVRDFDFAMLEYRMGLMKRTAEILTERYKHIKGSIEVEFQEQYRNMFQWIREVYDPVVTTVLGAMEELGIEPRVVPFRGGTDGARVTARGIPCPNIFAGGEAFHSKFEFLPVQSLIKAKEVVIAVIQKYAERRSVEEEEDGVE